MMIGAPNVASYMLMEMIFIFIEKQTVNLMVYILIRCQIDFMLTACMAGWPAFNLIIHQLEAFSIWYKCCQLRGLKKE